MQSYDCEDFTDIIPSLMKLHNTVVKLDIYGTECFIPLSFISSFTNLQELIFSFHFMKILRNYNMLISLNYKFHDLCPRVDLLIPFLENNGKNLKELYIDFYK